MRIATPIIIFVVTALLVIAGTFGSSQLVATVGNATGSASGMEGASAPEHAIAILLKTVQQHKWDSAYSQLANNNKFDQAAFIRDLAGSSGSLRGFSGLESWDLRPLHASDSEAEVLATLRWSTPVGPLEDVRDLKVVQQHDAWRVVWPPPVFPNIPAQVIPVNYLRWDLVSPGAGDEWGDRNVDAPRVRIISMNAEAYQEGTVVMGEVVNEDTIPAFVNVNATLLGVNGNPIDDEGSFDKISHVLLPKQVTPYRIDFPTVNLQDIKKVNMDIKATLVPASADPVIGVLNQKLDTDQLGRKVLTGQLLNQSGQIVDVPHVIATFYDNSGRVIWVGDGYVDRALFPQAPESFSIEVPNKIAGSVQNYHVVVNQYTLDKS
jgi:hypothetical protein